MLHACPGVRIHRIAPAPTSLPCFPPSNEIWVSGPLSLRPRMWTLLSTTMGVPRGMLVVAARVALTVWQELQ
eukprot:2169607-Heterocapsa_arctica.AAC.1